MTPPLGRGRRMLIHLWLMLSLARTECMPMWERVLVLFILIFCISSLYAVAGRGIGSAQPPIFPDKQQKEVILVSRQEWGAQPPVAPPSTLRVRPAPYVIISHTATNFCYTKPSCFLLVQITQTFHIESKGWDDIGYNFLVGGDGRVYVGRGWDVEGAHTFNYNTKSIGVSFIGNFNSFRPTEAQLEAAKALLEYGLRHGKLARNYKLLGHRQCIKTESPGQEVYRIIQTWEHWAPQP